MESDFKEGQRFALSNGKTLRIMGIVEGWIIFRFKTCAPMIKHKNEFGKYLEKIKAIVK